MQKWWMYMSGKSRRVILKIVIRGKTYTFDLSYLRENWGAPFIIAFMVMLMAAAGYLCCGLESIANDIAVYAYYSLVIGVVLQLICYLKYGEG
jgi:uncharacterized integral membrane protein